MYKRWFDLTVAVVIVVVIPVLLFLAVSGERGNEEIKTSSLPADTGNDNTLVTSEEAATLDISVLMDNGDILQMPLNTYVLHVVLAEMPADFETDALKAQAVVARTYALKRYDGNTKHPAAVCTESDCCQGYTSVESYLADGGKTEALRKIEAAVEETQNLVLVYNGSLIEATYFSCSGGMTEDAAAVWGADIPYLQSTESPGEESAEHYTDTVYFSTEEFERKLNRDLPEEPYAWLGEISYTKGGGIDTLEIAGMSYKGTQLRSLLGLRSTAFSITILGKTVIITTKGFGHRVGMSQYGADAMAVQGKTFDQILYHYYPGTELMMYDPCSVQMQYS